MKILFFGRLGETIGPEIEHELPPGGCTVAELRAALARTHGALAAASVRACIDHEIAPETALVLPTHEVAFIPPLSGG
jgi:molybdopterin synthase sulfur carrier subunit